MFFSYFRKTLLASLLFVFPAITPAISANSDLPQVSQVVTLMNDEIGSSNSFNLFALSRHIVSLSEHYRLDPLLVLSIIKVESEFKPRAQSHAGAIGLMQVMPIVIRECGKELSISRHDELYDPYKNTRIGIHYFTSLLSRYRNNVRHALVAYNMGPTALDRLISRSRGYPLTYYKKVMQAYRHFQKKAVRNIYIA